MLLSGAEEPEVWGMVQHEDVQMIITVKEGDTLTVFLDDPADTVCPSSAFYEYMFR